jgi:hypothetical protein
VNEKNLKPFQKGRSSEEAAKNGRKGGKRSGEVRSMNAMMRQALQSACTLGGDDLREMLQLRTGCTNAQALVQSILYGAIVNGNPKDKKLLLEMIGEDRPKEDLGNGEDKVKVEINLADTSGGNE